jgi:hypothetical protein
VLLILVKMYLDKQISNLNGSKEKEQKMKRRETFS